MRSLVRRHELASFLILAFALWWPWPMTLVNPDSIAMIRWGPAVAALLISWLALGGAGVGQLVRRLGQWRVGLRWYGAAFGIPLAAWALAAVVAMLVFDGQLVATLTPVDLLIFPVSFLTNCDQGTIDRGDRMAWIRPPSDAPITAPAPSQPHPWAHLVHLAPSAASHRPDPTPAPLSLCPSWLSP